MTKIVLQAEVAEQIRKSVEPIELVDDQGIRIGIVRRPPTEQEIEMARARMFSEGPKFTIDELIAKVEAL